MAVKQGVHAEANEAKAQETPVCGVIMPISGDDEYSSEHWRRVQRIIVRAIERAGMKPQMVWENPEADVIHSRILQGIYESDVVIADVSGLNPNVMLELGLRLSTKKPTLVITDGHKKPPFDIGVFQYHSYTRDLEYNSVDAFIAEISIKLETILTAYNEKRYKSFVENFTFEVVQPTEVTVTAEVAITERLDAFARQLSRMEGRITARQGQANAIKPAAIAFPVRAKFVSEIEDARQIVTQLMTFPTVTAVSHSDPSSKEGTMFFVKFSEGMSAAERDNARSWVTKTVDDMDVPF